VVKLVFADHYALTDFCFRLSALPASLNFFFFLFNWGAYSLQLPLASLPNCFKVFVSGNQIMIAPVVYPACPVGPEDRTGVKFENYLTGAYSLLFIHLLSN